MSSFNNTVVKDAELVYSVIWKLSIISLPLPPHVYTCQISFLWFIHPGGKVLNIPYKNKQQIVALFLHENG